MTGPLGQRTPFPNKFDPSVLFGIPRAENRTRLGIKAETLFAGFDIWNCYEVSWLDQNQIPQVAVLQLNIPCHSPNIIESKSLKLFLGSLNNTGFSTPAALEDCLASHLCPVLGVESMALRLYPPNNWDELGIRTPIGQCIDTCPNPHPKLQTTEAIVEEGMCSNLLRTICPVTEQPDFGTLQIHYQGKKILAPSLLGYLIALRNHKGFHEEVCEIIFRDIQEISQCQYLQAQCCFMRRGGIDINPVRYTYGTRPKVITHRLVRQ